MGKGHVSLNRLPHKPPAVPHLIIDFIVRTFFEDCHKNGYKFALGGEVAPKTKGYFFPITIIDNPPDQSKIVQEERKNYFFLKHHFEMVESIL